MGTSVLVMDMCSESEGERGRKRESERERERERKKNRERDEGAITNKPTLQSKWKFRLYTLFFFINLSMCTALASAVRLLMLETEYSKDHYGQIKDTCAENIILFTVFILSTIIVYVFELVHNGYLSEVLGSSSSS